MNEHENSVFKRCSRFARNEVALRANEMLVSLANYAFLLFSYVRKQPITYNAPH